MTAVSESVPVPTPEPAPAPEPAPTPEPAPAPEPAAAPSSFQGYDPQVLAQALAQAIQPLVPRPVEPAPPWESDDFLSDRKTFISGIQAMIAAERKRYEQEHMEPLRQQLATVHSLLPQLVARSMENPQYSTLDTKARELQKELGLNYWQAFQIAQKMNSQSAAPTNIKNVPKHLSSPDTKQSSLPDVADTGPAEFSDIVRSLRAKHGSNL